MCVFRVEGLAYLRIQSFIIVQSGTSVCLFLHFAAYSADIFSSVISRILRFRWCRMPTSSLERADVQTSLIGEGCSAVVAVPNDERVFGVVQKLLLFRPVLMI